MCETPPIRAFFSVPFTPVFCCLLAPRRVRRRIRSRHEATILLYIKRYLFVTRFHPGPSSPTSPLPPVRQGTDLNTTIMQAPTRPPPTIIGHSLAKAPCTPHSLVRVGCLTTTAPVCRSHHGLVVLHPSDLILFPPRLDHPSALGQTPPPHPPPDTFLLPDPERPEPASRGSVPLHSNEPRNFSSS